MTFVPNLEWRWWMELLIGFENIKIDILSLNQKIYVSLKSKMSILFPFFFSFFRLFLCNRKLAGKNIESNNFAKMFSIIWKHYNYISSTFFSNTILISALDFHLTIARLFRVGGALILGSKWSFRDPELDIKVGFLVMFKIFKSNFHC